MAVLDENLIPHFSGELPRMPLPAMLAETSGGWVSAWTEDQVVAYGRMCAETERSRCVCGCRASVTGRWRHPEFYD